MDTARSPLWTRSVGIGVVALAIVAAAAGCRKKDTPPALATPSLTLSRPQAPLGSPIDITYRFDVASGAHFDGDYLVLVHVEQPDGTLMWTDDHQPPVPTSKWQPGQHIEYTRTIFVPQYPFLGSATIRMGLYRNAERLPLNGADPKQRTYKVGTIDLRPTSDSVFLQYRTGWQPMEYTPDNSQSWQWTQKSGVLRFTNPRKDATLYLEYEGRPEFFPKPQQVTIWAGTQQITTFPADNKTPKLLRIPIPAAAFGTADSSEIRIDVDKTFVPAMLPAANSRDPRELGVRLFHIYLDPK